MIEFSIITATLNSEPTIRKCLTSLVQQKFNDFEIIIIDGNSTDKTIAICKEFQKLNRNIKIYSESDTGIYNAINKGIKYSSGKYIGFLHSDDVFYNNYTIKNISKYLKLYNSDGLYGNLLYVKSEKIIRNWNSKKFKKFNLFFGWMPPHPTLFIKREIYFELGMFNETYKISSDYDFILKLFKSKKNFNILYLDEIITKMSVGGASNWSIKNLKFKIKEDLSVSKRHFGYLNILIVFFKNLRKLNQFII